MEILLAVERLGGRLEPAGDNLRALLPADCSPELKAAIRQHKSDILDLFQARTDNLPPDCAPWLHVARHILTGEFDGADSSTIESLTIGFRGIRHSLCQQALIRLNARRATQ